MSDYRSLLERAAERVSPPDDAFEALARHRDRRRRTRRISSAALALVVAAAGIGVAVAALGGGRAPQPSASGPVSFHALWPDQTYAQAQATQSRVDAGREEWRTDRGEVARRFAETLLGATEVSLTFSPSNDDVVALVPGAVQVHGAVQPSQAPGFSEPRRFTLHFVQPLRTGPGGIWSVVKVDSGGITMPVEPGAEIRSGTTLELPTKLDDGTRVQAASTYIGHCGSSTNYVRARVRGGLISVRVGASTFEEHCGGVDGSGSSSSVGGSESAQGTGPGDLAEPVDGYVFVEVAPGAVDGYDPFTPGGPQGTVALQDFAAVAVRFVPAGTSESPGPTAEPSTGLAAYEDPAGWTISYPEDWSLGPFDENDVRLSFSGIVISNFAVEGGVLETSFLKDFPADGVVIELFHRSGGPAPIGWLPDDTFPLSFDAFDQNVQLASPQPPDVTAYQKDFVANSFQYTMVVWVGPGVTDTDRDAIRSVVSSLTFLPLRDGTVIQREFSYYVLATPGEFPVGSVTRFDPSNLPPTDTTERSFAFYLVHTDLGFYALAWPNDFAHGYKDCAVTYDASAQEFTCPNGAVWALDGSMVTNPDPSTFQDDPLDILLVRISLDGHLLVSPNTFMPTDDGLKTDYGLTGGR